MTGMTRLERLQKKYDDSFILGLAGVPQENEARKQQGKPELSADDIFDMVVGADPSFSKKMNGRIVFNPVGGKMVSWIFGQWEKKNFKLEDIRNGASSMVGQTMKLFHENKNKIVKEDGSPDYDRRSLMAHKTLDGLWNSVREFENDNNQSNREFKKLEERKASLESWSMSYPGHPKTHAKDNKGLDVIVPMTQYAAQFHGRGTRWCTSAREDNAFNNYASSGVLVIFRVPEDVNGPMKMFQAHFMPFLEDEAHVGGSIEFLNEGDGRITAEDNTKIAPYLDDFRDAIGKVFYGNQSFDILDGKYSERDEYREIMRKFNKACFVSPVVKEEELSYVRPVIVEKTFEINGNDFSTPEKARHMVDELAKEINEFSHEAENFYNKMPAVKFTGTTPNIVKNVFVAILLDYIKVDNYHQDELTRYRSYLIGRIIDDININYKSSEVFCEIYKDMSFDEAFGILNVVKGTSHGHTFLLNSIKAIKNNFPDISRKDLCELDNFLKRSISHISNSTECLELFHDPSTHDAQVAFRNLMMYKNFVWDENVSNFYERAIDAIKDSFQEVNIDDKNIDNGGYNNMSFTEKDIHAKIELVYSLQNIYDIAGVLIKVPELHPVNILKCIKESKNNYFMSAVRDYLFRAPHYKLKEIMDFPKEVNDQIFKGAEGRETLASYSEDVRMLALVNNIYEHYMNYEESENPTGLRNKEDYDTHLDILNRAIPLDDNEKEKVLSQMTLSEYMTTPDAAVMDMIDRIEKSDDAACCDIEAHFSKMLDNDRKIALEFVEEYFGDYAPDGEQETLESAVFEGFNKFHGLDDDNNIRTGYNVPRYCVQEDDYEHELRRKNGIGTPEWT